MSKSWWRDFDYVYKGIYLTRLIYFLLSVYVVMAIVSYINNKSIVKAWEIETGFLILLFLVGKILGIFRGK